MTDKQREALKALLRDHARRNTVDQKTARQSLIEEGIYTEDGELAPGFGGKTASSNDVKFI